MSGGEDQNERQSQADREMPVDGALDDLDEADRQELEEEAAGAGHPIDLSAPDSGRTD